MKELDQAIATKRLAIAALTAELDELLQVNERVDALLGASPVKPPPPRVPKQPRQEGPVRAEPKAEKPTPLCRVCRKPMPPRAKGQTGRPKTAHPACRAQAPRQPSTKAEPDPAPRLKAVVVAPAPAIAAKDSGLVLTADERARLLKFSRPEATRKQREKAEDIVEKGEKRAELRVAITPVPAAPPAAATKGTCECVDFESGKRCTLPFHNNKPPHSASGRAFYTALLPHELSKPRELDQLAMEGRG